jgi:transcription antitermination factor NusG
MNGLEGMSVSNIDSTTLVTSSYGVLNEHEHCSVERNPLFWYVAYTKGRHEKYVSKQLEERRINNFLPTYHSVRRWKDRSKELDLPLFPGYVFVHVAAWDRLRVLQVPGVVRFVSFNGRPACLENTEVESIKNAVVAGVKAAPHPYLKIGQKVRVKYGPLAGMTGILVRKKDKFRLVISLDLIMRSVAAEIQAADIDN